MIYSLALVKHEYLTGQDHTPAEFYLHLDQINYLSQQLYGVTPPAIHQGRMNMTDYHYMKSFVQSQEYIKDFLVLDPRVTEITDNLDRFRQTFVNHPGNYLDCYSELADNHRAAKTSMALMSHWLTVAEPKKIPGRPHAINRTQRWISDQALPLYRRMAKSECGQQHFFIGLEHEYKQFVADTDWPNLHWEPTHSLQHLAELIAGAETVTGNQSMALSVAIGLGHPDIRCEIRQDLAPARNECWFPTRNNIRYF